MGLSGEYYEDVIPETLDLAERARLAVHGLVGLFDTQLKEVYLKVKLDSNPSYLRHGNFNHWAVGKVLNALCLVRNASGSKYGLELEKKVIEKMLSFIEDGSYWASPHAWPPILVGHEYPQTDEEFTNPTLNSMCILWAMTAYLKRDGDSAWRRRIQEMSDALSKAAIHRFNYAYYPDGMIGEAFCMAKSGWKVKAEPNTEYYGMENTTTIHEAAPCIGLSRWYALSGDKKALELAEKLVNFITKPQFWGVWQSEHGGRAMRSCPFCWSIDPLHAHFPLTDHQHGRALGILGILEYAIVANNGRLKEFVRQSYEWMRNMGIPRIGSFQPRTENCALADMIFLAIRLSDSGIGEYWEDVDQYVRNGLAEGQLLDAETVKKQAPAKRIESKFDPDLPAGGQAIEAPDYIGPPVDTSENMPERIVGIFTGGTTGTRLMSVSTVCCPASSSMALYYAWEAIVRHNNGRAQINLLLNRASAWLDIDSYLPYEGKVLIRNKTTKKLAVRTPRWVDKKAVESRINKKEADPYWNGNYLIFDKLATNDVVKIEFPMVQTTESYLVPVAMGISKDPSTFGSRIIKDINYTCQFKGNTLIDINPREKGPGYPIYQRNHYKQNKAPTRKVKRYIPQTIIKW